MVNEIIAVLAVPLLIGSSMSLVALGIKVFEKASLVNSNKVYIEVRE